MEYFAFQELFEKIFVFYTLLKYFVFWYFRYLTNLVDYRRHCLLSPFDIHQWSFKRTQFANHLKYCFIALFCSPRNAGIFLKYLVICILDIWNCFVFRLFVFGIICIWNKDTQQLFTNSDYDESVCPESVDQPDDGHHGAKGCLQQPVFPGGHPSKY